MRYLRQIQYAIEVSNQADVLISMNAALTDDSSRARPAPAPIEYDDDFARRWRIALLEDDRALRAVIVVSLLRVGCIIRFAHAVEPVCAELRDGMLQGAIIAGELSAPQLAALRAANAQRAPIIVLTNAPCGPGCSDAETSLRFLPKPFDMRELFALLDLDHIPPLNSGQRSEQ